MNDNFDCWHLGFRELVDKFVAADVPGMPIIELLAPEPAHDYYVLNPFHSGFFRTGLEVLPHEARSAEAGAHRVRG